MGSVGAPSRESGRTCHHRPRERTDPGHAGAEPRLLARQHLLERTTRPIDVVVEDVGGLQTQYAPSGYVGLWTRVAGFRRDDLTAALEERRIIQATLMRTTIHMVSRREFWPYVAGITRARREWAMRVQPRGADEAAWWPRRNASTRRSPTGRRP